MNELLAWIVFPLVALGLCTGIGLLAERAARAELQPALLPALGFATAIVVLAPLFATGAGESPALVVLVAAAAAGFVLGRARLADLRPGLGAAAGVAAYALHIAPVVLSGKATFLGYNLLNDTAIHLSLVDWIGDHGSRLVAQPPSSYAAAIHDYVGSDYPLGSHELLAALRPVVGLDPALVYQPFLALSAGIAAAAVYALLRAERMQALPAALGAFAALASQLVFSFALQGGIKELSFIACLVAAAALVRRPVLMALPAAALYAIYGVYALPWIVPLALVALWLVRPALRTAAVASAVFIVAIAVALPGSIRYWRHGHDVITKASELGPLAGPLKSVQATGIWLRGDYRFTPDHAWLTYVLIVVALALGLAGAVAAIRRRSAAPLALLVSALVAWAAVALAGSPYVTAKALAVLSPAVVVAVCLGIAWLAQRRRSLALATAAVLGLAVIASDALAYRIALVAPVDRLAELSAIDKRFAGQGPMLINEFEEYIKHYVRHARGSDPYESWTAGRAQLRPGVPLNAAHAYDLDELTLPFVERYPLVAVRRSPAASRPPSNYTRAFRGRWYEVWRRARPAPSDHVSAGAPPLQPSAVVACGRLRSLARSSPLVAALRPEPVVVDIAAAMPLPPGWYRDGQDPAVLHAGKGGSVTTTFAGGGRLRVWLRGTTHRAGELVVDGTRLTVPRQPGRASQWIDVGTVSLRPGRHTMQLVRPKRSLRPGDAQADLIGPVELTPEGDPIIVRVPPARLCGRPIDWIDVLAR